MKLNFLYIHTILFKTINYYMTLHNTGDLVQIKSRLWFEDSKNIGSIFGFTDEMAAYCGMVL